MTYTTRILKSNMKTTVIAFLSGKAIIHFEFISRGQNSTKFMWKYWGSYLKSVCRKKYLNFLPNDFILHHVKASAHKAISVKKFLAK